jgi:hypothetical protein
MSDFPKGGDISSTRTWLDRKGFIGIFNNWEADAIFGLSEEKIMAKVPGERGEMLWGLLNTARQTTGKTSIICSHSSFFTLFVVFFLSIFILYFRMSFNLYCFFLLFSSGISSSASAGMFAG